MSRERIMLTQAIPAVQQLRRVQGFDPLRFLKRNANGGIELEPRYQRLWFRLACPDGKMLLNRLRVTDQIAVYEAQVFLSREDNQPITNFTAAVEKAQAPAGRYVQAAQDEALKTALDNAGFGIQLCEINPSAAVDAQADGKQEVATGAVNRQVEEEPATERATISCQDQNGNDVTESKHTRISVTNTLGEEIWSYETTENNPFPLTWNLQDNNGKRVSAGQYYCKGYFETSAGTIVTPAKKIVVITQ